MNEISLLGFLKSWLAWAESDGALEAGPYDDYSGLCQNVRNYVNDLFDKSDYSFDKAEARATICNLLKAKLRKDHPDLSEAPLSSGSYNPESDYPFNGGSAESYVSEVEGDSMHKNPNRLAWVRKTIAELET